MAGHRRGTKKGFFLSQFWYNTYFYRIRLILMLRALLLLINGNLKKTPRLVSLLQHIAAVATESSFRFNIATFVPCRNAMFVNEAILLRIRG